jgi:hypothetical protein
MEHDHEIWTGTSLKAGCRNVFDIIQSMFVSEEVKLTETRMKMKWMIG